MKIYNNLNSFEKFLVMFTIAILVILLLSSAISKCSEERTENYKNYICIYDLKLQSYLGKTYTYRFPGNCDHDFRIIYNNNTYKLYNNKDFIKSNVIRYELIRYKSYRKEP